MTARAVTCYGFAHTAGETDLILRTGEQCSPLHTNLSDAQKDLICNKKEERSLLLF